MRVSPRDPSPYVGPRPFETEQRHLFFGREKEAGDLLAFVVSNPVILFYAISGCGKTSLLNARLIPQLEEEEYVVLPVARLSGVLPDDVQVGDIQNIFMYHTLLSICGATAEAQALATASISEILHRITSSGDAGEDTVRVLIFDQFEEIFTRHLDRWQERHGFFEAISQLASEDPLIRILFAMREDHLAQLEPYVDLLPGGLRARYRMEPLREEPALLAVKQPLETTSRRFADGVAEALVEELLQQRVENERGETVKTHGEFVEPVQLQVVCRSLWDSLPAAATVITEEHRRQYANVDQALSRFYEHAISAAAQEASLHPRVLREWCQRDLITSTGTRSFVHRGPEETAGLPNEAIKILDENFHLIRPERRAGATWYELTHDRLIGAIQDSNEKWNAQYSEKGKKALSLLQDLDGTSFFD